MKWVGRILIILIAAALVSGVFFVLTRGNNGAQFGDARIRPDGGLDGQFPQGGFAPGQQRQGGGGEGGFRPGRGGEFERGGFNFLGIGGHLVPITIIVVVVLLIERLFSWRRSRRVTSKAVASE